MVKLQNTLEGGTSGAAVTEANSGGMSGDAFDYFDISAGGSCTYTTTAFQGSRAMSFAGSGARAFAGWYVATTTRLSLRFYVRLPSAPSTTIQMFTPRHSSNYVAGLNLTSSAKIQVAQSQAADGRLAFTTTSGLSLNTWYRVEISWEVGTTASNGKIQFKYFLGDSLTAVESFSTVSADLFTAPIVDLRFGKLGTSGDMPLIFDAITCDNATTTLLGPYVVSNSAPIANAGAGGVDIEPGTVLTLNGTGSYDPDGSIVSHVWTQTSGPVLTMSGTGATRTVVAPYTLAGAVLGFNLTVTDNNGAVSSAAVSFSVLSCTERAVIGGAEVPMSIHLATA